MHSVKIKKKKRKIKRDKLRVENREGNVEVYVYGIRDCFKKEEIRVKKEREIRLKKKEIYV